MRYFSFFPKTNYTFDDGVSYTQITNLLKRVKYIDDLKNNSIMYYQYEIKDGERPDVVAHKVYGDSEKHWLILYLNDIVDIRSQWPLTYEEFKNYIIDTYGSISNAKSQIHGYFKTEKTTILNSDDSNRIVTTQIDFSTYTALTALTENRQVGNFTYQYKLTKTSKTKYDYENELNESKRNIILLKPDYVPTVMTNLSNLLNV